jgi:hypothetical protein
MKDFVNTILRKDGTVVTITPTDGLYEVAVDDEHRTVGPEMAADPLNDPEFDAIVRELKKCLNAREVKPRRRNRPSFH